jgi:hypothetical protein
VALAQGLGLESRSYSDALSTAVYERRQPIDDDSGLGLNLAPADDTCSTRESHNRGHVSRSCDTRARTAVPKADRARHRRSALPARLLTWSYASTRITKVSPSTPS